MCRQQQYALHLLDIIQFAQQSAFMSSNAIHPAGVHGRLPHTTENWSPIAGAGWLIQFVLHLIMDAVSAQPRANCIYLDHSVVGLCKTFMVSSLSVP